ncbi:hypothetical protein B0T17DRAFT_234363 [Bombardia bombarda]|uniref:Uncharacterized protein n=1 Tax=Bombardia bombarda TaxID=252184 RepID=A0AA39XBI3_9PEZI|nr:hypothetical protein B0T17DRAFT_234363 [Bombardia bombarda]
MITILPCSDETIQSCLRGFDIRFLNWNKHDLCVETLRIAGLNNLKELWLSWSGRNSVLYSWSCREHGLPTLNMLETVRIEAKASIESTKQYKENINKFAGRLQKSLQQSLQPGDASKEKDKSTQPGFLEVRDRTIKVVPPEDYPQLNGKGLSHRQFS